MHIEKLNYELPEELIAQSPSAHRGGSRLLVLDRFSGSLQDDFFANLSNHLRSGDCLVLNNTKVLAAKFFIQRKTGAKLEGLFLEQTDDLWLVFLKGAGRIKANEELLLLDKKGGEFCSVIARRSLAEGRWQLSVQSELPAEKILTSVGFAPLPPYIKRKDICSADEDLSRYQTVYSRFSGAVAAPTAGLHFTDEQIYQLKDFGISFAEITLHVGAGTFLPVKVDNLQAHKMHSERFIIDAANAEIINTAKAAGRRIIAVGTTSVRTLETVSDAAGRISAGSGQTEIFITPGYKFKAVDAMLTNFHLPKSTLLALVAAFASLEQIMTAYRYAIAGKYRFYSYGDAMFIY